jgi:hypothetical protein
VKTTNLIEIVHKNMLRREVIEGRLMAKDYILTRADFEIIGCIEFPCIINRFDGKRVRITIEELPNGQQI